MVFGTYEPTMVSPPVVEFTAETRPGEVSDLNNRAVVSINGVLQPMDGFPTFLFSPLAKLMAFTPWLPKLISRHALDAVAVQRLIDSGAMQIVAVTDPMQLGFARQAMIGIRCTGDTTKIADKLAAMPLDQKILALSEAFQKARTEGTGLADLQALMLWVLRPLAPILPTKPLSLAIALMSGLLSMVVHPPFQEMRWAWLKALLGLAMFEATLGAIENNCITFPGIEGIE